MWLQFTPTQLKCLLDITIFYIDTRKVSMTSEEGQNDHLNRGAIVRTIILPFISLRSFTEVLSKCLQLKTPLTNVIAIWTCGYYWKDQSVTNRSFHCMCAQGFQKQNKTEFAWRTKSTHATPQCALYHPFCAVTVPMVKEEIDQNQ